MFVNGRKYWSKLPLSNLPDVPRLFAVWMMPLMNLQSTFSLFACQQTPAPPECFFGLSG